MDTLDLILWSQRRQRQAAAKGKGGGFSWSSYWATRIPTDLIVTGMRDTEIDFEWTDNSTGDTTFRVLISSDDVTYVEKGTTLAGVTTYTATGLTAGTLYYFKVVGYKDASESTATNTYDTRFKITIDTTKEGSAADTFVLPVTGKSASNYYVNWGDGSAEETFTTTGNKTHVYLAAGTYQITVRGGLTAIAFNNTGDKLKLISIDNWGNLKLTTMLVAFFGCNNMRGKYKDVPNTSSCTSFQRAFENCSLFNSPVTFSLGLATSVAAMFSGCSAFNQPILFNTSNISLFWDMFRNCYALKQSLAAISLASATDITNMLFGCNINATGTTTNYDATLVAWAAQDVPDSLNFHGGASKYSAAGGGQAARASLIADDLWTITDGGLL